MNRVTGFFLEDWRRKLLALGIAILIWSWVEGQIAVDEEIQLSLVVGNSEERTPEDFQLLVHPPDGWVLTSPAEGELIPIRLHGSASELTDFRGNQCAASIRIVFNADPNQDRFEYQVTPDKLDWMREGDAAFLLKGVQGAQQLQSLTFERLDDYLVVLSHLEVPVQGTPSTAHDARTDMMEFEPSQVTLSGPKFAIEQLKLKIDGVRTGRTELLNSSLLRPLRIEEEARSDIRAMLSLHDDIARLGIQMDPPMIRAKLPIRLKEREPERWTPEVSDLIIISADDEKSRGPWTYGSWVPSAWQVSMPDVEVESELSRAWIREHIHLILPMNTLTADSLDEVDLRIEAALFGLNPTEHAFYSKHLIIEPVDPKSATVKVTRTP
ncbi:MAG: hypothetical protein ACPG31_10875 [Planctomycetota bacterium]